MGNVTQLLGRAPSWLLILFALVLVALIGYVDYLTGDYSMVIFYGIPIAGAAWLTGDKGAIITSLAAGFARYSSDCASYASAYAQSSVRYWNSIQDMLFLLIVGLLISNTKRVLDDEKKPGDSE